MFTKEFENSIQFYHITDSTGNASSLPLVNINLIQPGGKKFPLSMIFDTGASVTVLRDDLYLLLGLSSWDVGTLDQAATAGGVDPVDFYRYDGITLEVFGKVLSCPVNLMKIPPNPLYHGLLGRDTIFQEFGFGFWERAQELYVNPNP